MTKPQYRNFSDFFKQATGYDPYFYQVELAESDDYNIINVPTGAGKTEAAVLGLWLWKRVNDVNVPKRLVYCLPMRILVEQTYEKVKNWIKKLGLEGRISVEIFMGGDDTKIERILPSKECIIIGTQDILISGALNRAYGSWPASWPIVFGLLNNDCVWIMDEIQIMENALPTSMQLDIFRNNLGTFGPHKTVWMSATINPDWMNTVDFQGKEAHLYELEDANIKGILKKRHQAVKTLHKAPFELKNEYKEDDIIKMLELHESGTTTVIILNTVKRAQSVFKMLSKKHNCNLIHSRFRGEERKFLNEWLSKLGEEQKDQIIISTQVIEAGVDISVKTMITELAPWANMVQRFGRCNRYGEHSNASIHWIDIDKTAFLPYEEKYMEISQKKLTEFNCKSVSPCELKAPEEMKVFDAVLRKNDIVELFDTTPDLAGGHVDVSRFVRSMEQPLDIGVFWRELQSAGPETQPSPIPEEICNVPIYELINFLKKKKVKGHIWNYTDKSWDKISADDLFPGQIIMLDCDISGYNKQVGWDILSSKPVEQIRKSGPMPESYDGDIHSETRDGFVTLADHTRHVFNETNLLLKENGYIDADIQDAILIAAKYHDIGKTHDVFQNAIQNNDGQPMAKGPSLLNYSRTGFRHEVASMLAYLKQDDQQENKLRNLIAYLIVSHHGRVRLSLRTSKTRRVNTDNSFLLGIKIDGETLPEFTSNLVYVSETKIDMTLASMGRDASGNPSWAERVLGLLDAYGPFRLGYMETLLRRADWKASENEENGVYNDK